jgi:hypothetical protein
MMVEGADIGDFLDGLVNHVMYSQMRSEMASMFHLTGPGKCAVCNDEVDHLVATRDETRQCCLTCSEVITYISAFKMAVNAVMEQFVDTSTGSDD